MIRANKGTILIVTLWMLAILTVFALALGQRASLEVKLAEYQTDSLKAEELCRAAIERLICEKQYNETVKGIDVLSESWANNEAAFKDFALGDGRFTVSFSLDGETLYGAEDEESKINVNEVDEQVLERLLRSCAGEDEYAEDITKMAKAIIAWHTEGSDEEEEYYPDPPYSCKNSRFESLAELLLVRYGYGEDEIISPAMLFGEDKDGDGELASEEEGVARYLTVFGSGKVNINTASEKVLSALLDEEEFPGLAAKIVDFRLGDKDEIEDDQWFAIGTDTVTLSSGESKTVKNLEAEDDPGDNFEPNEWGRLKKLATQEPKELSVSSNIYTVHAQAEVRKVKKSFTAIINLTDYYNISYKYWHED